MYARRLGRFYVSSTYGDGLPEILYAMKFTPLRVEYMAHCGDFEYIGKSPLFDKMVQPSTRVPEYLIYIDRDEDGKITVRAEKIGLQ